MSGAHRLPMQSWRDGGFRSLRKSKGLTLGKIVIIFSPTLTSDSKILKEVRVAHKITEECINCGACIDVCPEEAITEGDEISVIDPEKCTDCGSCVEVCPTDAIVEA